MSEEQHRILEVLELLREVREKVQSDTENSVVNQLDEVMLELEEISRERQPQITPQQLLEWLGKAIELVPAIVKLIELLNALR